MRVTDFYRQLQTGTIPPLILFHGQESLLLERAHQALRQALFPAGEDAFNDSRFAARNLDADQVLESVMTLPVFARRRLVTITDAQQLAAATMEQLLPYVQQPVAETCLLLLADKIDKRKKFFQLLQKQALVVEFKPLSERELPDYLRQTLVKAGCDIDPDAVRLFCSMVGPGLQEVQRELDKLINYLGQRTRIGVEDVQAVVSRGRAENIFALGQAVGRGECAAALSLVGRLTSAGEAPLRVLALLVRHFRQLWKVSELELSGLHSRQEIARLSGVPAFVIDGLMEQARRFSRQDLGRIQELLLATDLAMKSSGSDDAVLLESLVIRLATGNYAV